MVQCQGCPAPVFFDNVLHKKLLEDYANALGKQVSELTKEELNVPNIKDLGTGRPFDAGTKRVHQCPGYDPKKGWWKGRENKTRKIINGHPYNIPINNTITPSPKPIVKKEQEEEEVIIFSEQSILDTQKQILKEIQSIKAKIFGDKDV